MGASLSCPNCSSSVIIQNPVFTGAEYCRRNPPAWALRELDSGEDEAVDYSKRPLIQQFERLVLAAVQLSKTSLVQRLEHEEAASQGSALTHSVTTGMMRNWKKAYFGLDHSGGTWEASREAASESGETLRRNQERLVKRIKADDSPSSLKDKKIRGTLFLAPKDFESVVDRYCERATAWQKLPNKYPVAMSPTSLPRFPTQDFQPKQQAVLT